MKTDLNLMVLLLSFLGHAGLIAAFLDWRFEMAFLAAISGYVLLLFGASLTGALYQAHLVLLYSGLPALLVAAWLLWRKGSGRRSLLLQPPLVLFLIYAVLAYLALSGRRLVSWDEFTHWGLIVKVIAETSALVKHNSIILCQDYPPGTALLMYHMLKGAGNSEGHMLFANSFLYFLPMLAFLRGVTWKRWGEIALVLLIVYTGVWTLSCGYGYLMVDPILALLFGAAFAIYVGEERSVRGILMAALILATVVLVKKIGFFLAIIGGALILTDQLFCRPRKERRLSCIVAALAVFALAVTVNYSWHGYVVKNGLGQTFTQPMTTKDVIHSLSSKANEYQRSVRDNFITSILHWDLTKKVNRTLEPYRGPYTLAVWLALIATLYVVAFLGERDRWGRRRLFVTMAVFFTGLVIYLFGLLVLYMFTFPLHEAPYAASFARYVNIYTFGFLLAGMAAIQTVYGADPVGRAVRITTLGALAIIFLSLAPLQTAVGYWKAQPKLAPEDPRVKYASGVDAILRLTPPGARIYFIIQNTIGDSYYTLSYEIAPRLNNHTNICWSIRAPGKPLDYYQCDYTPDKWTKVLSGENYDFDYVWVVEADPPFWETYGQLFDDNGAHKPGLYRIIKEKGTVRLTPVTGRAS